MDRTEHVLWCIGAQPVWLGMYRKLPKVQRLWDKGHMSWPEDNIFSCFILFILFWKVTACHHCWFRFIQDIVMTCHKPWDLEQLDAEDSLHAWSTFARTQVTDQLQVVYALRSWEWAWCSWSTRTQIRTPRNPKRLLPARRLLRHTWLKSG